jgi:hypothetical protein
MGGSQFDRLTREVARGTSRRTLMKTMLGLGGALIAGNRLGLERAEAARRGYSGPSLPTQLPVPPICPEGQSWNGAACVCTAGVPCGMSCCGEGTICTDQGCAAPPPSCPDGQQWNGTACECTAGFTCGADCCADGTTCSSDTCIANPGCVALGQACSQGPDCCSNYCANSVCHAIPHGGGCFVGETRIAMAGGTSRSVSDIVEGDLVLGDNGCINRVVGIDRLTLGDRKLYGLNGSSPFVTASHPFMTDDGWKAIDPTTSFVDHRVPAVGRLDVGHRLVLLSGVLAAAGATSIDNSQSPSDTQTQPLILSSIQHLDAPAATPLFNLRLDGNHTYFANDLLVHNKIFRAPSPGVDDLTFG